MHVQRSLCPISYVSSDVFRASRLVIRTLMSHECQHEGDAEGQASAEGSSEDLLVGGLILRGNKCVLIRSLTGEWEGMRLPWGAASLNGSTSEAAVQIASELCETGLYSPSFHFIFQFLFHLILHYRGFIP